jgi:hypothetical protein
MNVRVVGLAAVASSIVLLGASIDSLTASAPAVGPTACSGARTGAGVTFFAEVVPGGTQLTTETFRGSLHSLSFRAVRDVRTSAPSRLLGKQVGTVETAYGTRHNLRLPTRRSADGRYDLLKVANPDGSVTKVTLRTQASTTCTTPLTVTGLPFGTRRVVATIRGEVMAAAHECPVHPLIYLYGQRLGASPFGFRSGGTC